MPASGKIGQVVPLAPLEEYLRHCALRWFGMVEEVAEAAVCVGPQQLHERRDGTVDGAA